VAEGAVHVGSRNGTTPKAKAVAECRQVTVKCLDPDAEMNVAGERLSDQDTAEPDEDESSSSDGESYPSGPLQEGPYIWRPEVPFKVFSAHYEEAGGSRTTAFHEVSQLTLTDFLGSGAEGTVYKASYCDSHGGTVHCAIKFALVNTDQNPDTHPGVDMLTQKKYKKPLSSYESEKKALHLLRPKNEQQWRDFATSPVRMMQFLGFNDSVSALLLEPLEGGRPDPKLALMESAKEFLKHIEEETEIKVGDVKFGNMVRDKQGRTAIIDFGKCQYMGGAKCQRCNKWIDQEIDVHAQEHVVDYLQQRKERGAVSRLRLQEFCYDQSFC
jgi:hypothetical protein